MPDIAIPTIRTTAIAGSALLLASLATPTARADTYVLDKGHTHIGFSWNHLGLSRQHGRFIDYDGEVFFDQSAPEKSTIAVTIKTASVSTGVPKLDDHLRTADFFDAAKFPDITFKSTAIKKTGDKTGEVTGDLTMMGVTKPVTMAVTWNFTGEHPLSKFNPAYKDKFASGFSGVARLNRSDWGIKRNVPLVSDEIAITIESEMMRK
jgi:polyisoprenoid-binding protein YceI